jgi:hypothetical protein
MAKRRHNKAALIREIEADKPNATAAEIVAALAAKRVKVTPAYIYALRAKGNGKPAKGHGKPMAAALAGIESLVMAKRMADELGGIDKARDLLGVLAKLV